MAKKIAHVFVHWRDILGTAVYARVKIVDGRRIMAVCEGVVTDRTPVEVMLEKEYGIGAFTFKMMQCRTITKGRVEHVFYSVPVWSGDFSKDVGENHEWKLVGTKDFEKIAAQWNAEIPDGFMDVIEWINMR